MNTPDLPPHVGSGLIVPLGICWYCFHQVSDSPNWTFIRALENFVPDDRLADAPEFYDEHGGPARWHWLPFIVETKAHAQCAYLARYAIPMPDSPDEPDD
jgi:hypothetical protein